MGDLKHIKEAVGRVMEKTKQTMFIDELHELLYKFGAEIRVIEDCVGNSGMVVQFNEFKTPDISLGDWVDCDFTSKDYNE